MSKRIRCPDCNSTNVAKLYCTTETVIYCQNGSHKGFNAYKTLDNGKTFEKVAWNYQCPDEIAPIIKQHTIINRNIKR